MSKHSVSNVVNIAKEKSIIYEKIKYLSEDEVYRMIFPDKFAVENLYEQPDYEYIHRNYVYQEKYNSRIQRLIKLARLRFPQTDMHGVYYDGRELNKSLLKELFQCQYIDCHQSIVLQGPTGSGKTYLACALAKQACLGQIKARYIRLPDLLMEYGDASIIQGKQKRLLASYSKIPLLIIDEWLVSDMSDKEIYFLFELFERRSDTTSTIFCTQYRQEDWVTRLNESVQAEAIVDRYAHTSFWIEMGSMNMREYCVKNKI